MASTITKGPRVTDDVLGLAVMRLRLRRGDEGVITSPPPPPTTVLEYALRYRFIEDRPFSLADFLPLEGIYADTHRHIVIMKPAQRGLSEYAINYALYALEEGATAWTAGKKNGLNVGYVFPTQAALGDFSKERLGSLGEETPHLGSMFGARDEYNTVTFKEVRSRAGGKSYFYLRSGGSTKALKSFPADVLIRDEYDEHSPLARALAFRRLNASLVRRVLDLSTPTIPGYGIHEAYLASDRRVYVQSHSCGARNTYDFHRDVWVGDEPYALPDAKGWRTLEGERVRARRVWLRCPACGAEVTEAERVARGEWRVTNPEVVSVHGYHVPWWPWPFVSLEDLAYSAVSRDPQELEQFYHSDLGLPYGGSGAAIQVNDVLGMSADLPGGVVPELGRRSPVLGVDVGTRLYYWLTALVDDRETAVEASSVGTFEELYRVMETRKVGLCVVDAAPEGHEVAKFKARFPGRVISAGYPANVEGLKDSMLAPVKEGRPHRDKIVADGKVQVNRTLAMDAVSAAVKGRLERWPAEICRDPEVQGHLTSPQRTIAVNDRGEPRATWVHTRPDHLFHARVYALVARALFIEAVPSSVSAPPPRGGYHAQRRRVL